MYENAGINLGCCKYAKYDYEGEEGTWYYCTKEGKECWTYPNGDADCVEKGYPPFTAEKQIELIKWLGELDMLEIMRTIREDKAWIINSEYGMSGNVYKHTSSMKSFEEALARLINSLWQDLTVEEKQQVKGILE
jgi:hypothetical protein